jgi:hypothetical protein
MSRRLKLAVTAGAVALIGMTIATTHAGSATQTVNSYAVKFNCGEYGKFLQATPAERLEGPVKPGDYQTVINVHNPQLSTPVDFKKKAILLFSGTKPINETKFEQPKQPGNLIGASLPPDFGMLIDCQDIRKVLLPGIPPAPTFIEGWVVFLVTGPAAGGAPLPLDVTAVYTSNGFNCVDTGCTTVTRNGFSEDLVVITPTTVTS